MIPLDSPIWKELDSTGSDADDSAIGGIIGSDKTR